MADREKKGKTGKGQKEEKPVEKLFTVGMQVVYNFPVTRRMAKANTFLRRFVFKHSRVREAGVFFSNGLNERLWERGREHPPRKLKIKVLLKGGRAFVFLQDEKAVLPEEEKGKEKKEEKKEKKTPEEEAAEKEAEKLKEDKKIAEKSAEAAAMKRGQ